MTKIKFSLTLVVALALLFTGAFSVMAKEKENKWENKGKNKDKTERTESARTVVLPLFGTTTIQLLGTSTPILPPMGTTSPTSTSTPVTSTTTPPIATTTTPTTSTTTPPASTATTTVSTSTPSIIAPIINIFTPKKNATSTNSTTTPAFAGISGQVNDTLANGFFGTNYYGSSAFDSGTTRALKFVGISLALIGILLVGSGALRNGAFKDVKNIRVFPTRRYYS